MQALTGKDIQRLMRAHGTTIRAVATHMSVPLKRVREVREKGVAGPLYCQDWQEGIAGAGASPRH